MRTNCLPVGRPASILAILVLGISVSTSALAQSGCLQPGAAAKQIDIALYGTNLVFENKHACAGGKGAPNNGDVCMNINEKSDLRFLLKANASQDWKIIGFQLSDDGISWPGTLPLGAYSDFQFDSDTGLLTGTPYVEINPNGNQMTVQNNNCHEFEVHYRVSLENKNNGEIVRLHPVIKNRGTD